MSSVGPASGELPDRGHVHIVAVGGVMMSAIARLLVARGCTVSGSDLHDSPLLDDLRREGVAVHVGGHDAALVPPETILLARSSAVPETNPEVAEARRRGLEVLKRDEVLGRLVNPLRGLAVAGTHGKTTTSGLAAVLLVEADLDPTFLVGSVVANYRTNCRRGAGEWIVVEADEYDRAFLTLAPAIAVVGNLENDHPDIYADLEDLVATFRQFVGQVKPDGLVLLGADCPRAAALAEAAAAPCQTFGFAPTADWRIGPWRDTPAGLRFAVRTPDGAGVTVTCGLHGRHNALNATAALAAAVGAGLPAERAAALLARAKGTWRRLEVLYDRSGLRIVDDYAHHPSEVRATIAAARAWGGRLRVIYEPHQYARTRALKHDYAGAFDQADETLLLPIHAARETDLSGVSSAELAELAGGAAAGVRACPDDDSAAAHLLATRGDNETWLFMGAGNITYLAHRLADRLAEADG